MHLMFRTLSFTHLIILIVFPLNILKQSHFTSTIPNNKLKIQVYFWGYYKQFGHFTTHRGYVLSIPSLCKYLQLENYVRLHVYNDEINQIGKCAKLLYIQLQIKQFVICDLVPISQNLFLINYFIFVKGIDQKKIYCYILSTFNRELVIQ